jgi:hypothetical protein
MAEPKVTDFQKEAYWSMKNITFMQRQALASIKDLIDGPNTSPEEIIILIRKTCAMYVPDKRDE